MLVAFDVAAGGELVAALLDLMVGTGNDGTSSDVPSTDGMPADGARGQAVVPPDDPRAASVPGSGHGEVVS